MLATLGGFIQFRVASSGNRGSVTRIFGEKNRRRQRKKKPGSVQGVPKPAAQLLSAVPSVMPPSAHPGASGAVQGGGGGPKPVAKATAAVPSEPGFTIQDEGAGHCRSSRGAVSMGGHRQPGRQRHLSRPAELSFWR